MIFIVTSKITSFLSCYLVSSVENVTLTRQERVIVKRLTANCFLFLLFSQKYNALFPSIPTYKAYHFIYKVFINETVCFVVLNWAEDLTFKIQGLDSQKPQESQSFISQA